MNEERILDVLRAPHVSEKATYAAENGQYIFQVAPGANKREIKKAVEALFEVSVTSVRVINQKGKTKRFGARMGKRSDLRKAYVRLAEGQELELMNVE